MVLLIVGHVGAALIGADSGPPAKAKRNDREPNTGKIGTGRAHTMYKLLVLSALVICPLAVITTVGLVLYKYVIKGRRV